MARHLILPAMLASVALTACPPELPDEQPPPNPDTATFLIQFDSCDELTEHVAEAWTDALVQSRYGYGWGWLEGDDVDGEAPANDSGPDDYSETNTQEEGVDEPDIVETDGEYIYVANRGELTIVDTWPAEESHKVGSLPLDNDNWYASGMFLQDDRIVIYGYDWDAFDNTEGWHSSYGTRIQIVDVSDRAEPALLREVVIEGWFVDARRIEDDVYTVIDTWMGVPYPLYDLLWDDELELPEMDWEASQEEQDAIRDEAREIIAPLVDEYLEDVDVEELLPRVQETVAGQVGDVEALLECDEIYRPADGYKPSILSVAHLDMATGETGGDVSATGLMSEGWQVYASAENLYVSQTSWWWWWGWGDLDLQTHIHKFELSGGDTDYVASGAVDGWVLNQFSFGEHDGYLRVATTDIDWWWGTPVDEDVEETEPANNVFVLEQRGGSLELTGEIRGIAPNERIFSARFTGERGFLVTFEQIDPLFTLDLSNPYNPQVVGELEITGFSSYLHPVGEDHLVSVGMEATPEGQITGLAVSLFDVSDFADPTLQDRWTLESDDWSWSEALWDHHAFTLHNGVLSFPAYTWNDGEYFSGLVVLDVDTDAGLTQLGTVDHADLVAESDCLYGNEWDCNDYYWYAWMRRSVVIEDGLYSISDYGLKVNELTAPTNELASVLFWPND